MHPKHALSPFAPTAQTSARPDPLGLFPGPVPAPHAVASDPLGIAPRRAAYAASQAATELAGTLPGTPADPARPLELLEASRTKL